MHVAFTSRPDPEAAPVAELKIAAEAGEVRRASDWLAAVCAEYAMPADDLMRLDLCFNEALANIISHGGAGAMRSPVVLQLVVSGTRSAGQAALAVIDSGVPFDSVAAMPGPRPERLADAVPGGLGLSMMHDSADKLTYRFQEGRNHLSIVVRWPKVM